MSIGTRRLVRGSYPPGDVTFLLTDISDRIVEQPVESREAWLQSGVAHYSETLPVEYRPSAEYLALFHELLAAQSHEIALLTAVLGERLLEETDQPVLASLARAGTPVGVLLRRWMARRGVDAAHYSVSIVRDRGIDSNALRWITQRHDPRRIRFIDGWTGKGVIATELRRAAQEFPAIDPRLAVLADPGWCSELFATRDDVLIPSATLNATVSGLVSRTVLNDLIGPEDFHGAKSYPELAAEDLSQHFVDTVTQAFDGVSEDEIAATGRAARSAPPPDHRGRRIVEALQREHGLPDINLVKPSIGEATRVLLRRVPFLLLVDPTTTQPLGHLRRLAADRGVPVEERTGLGYAACALIRPTRSTPQ